MGGEGIKKICMVIARQVMENVIKMVPRGIGKVIATRSYMSKRNQNKKNV